MSAYRHRPPPPRPPSGIGKYIPGFSSVPLPPINVPQHGSYFSRTEELNHLHVPLTYQYNMSGGDVSKPLPPPRSNELYQPQSMPGFGYSMPNVLYGINEQISDVCAGSRQSKMNNFLDFSSQNGEDNSQHANHQALPFSKSQPFKSESYLNTNEEHLMFKTSSSSSSNIISVRSNTSNCSRSSESSSSSNRSRSDKGLNRSRSNCSRATSGSSSNSTSVSNNVRINSNSANISGSSSSNISENIPERGRERIHNDYNQHFVDTGERSQNFIRDAEELERFAEYPKLDKLMQLKKEVNLKRATPSRHIQADLRVFDFTSLKTKFDVILVDPPWAEYHLRVAGGFTPEDLTPWTLEDMKKLPVDQLGETPSFCFLWCGVTHLEEARILLGHWGYRRCEDICWLKTNKKASQRRREGKNNNTYRIANVIHDEHSLFQRSNEHCLMGIKGTVKRSADTYFIHANLDTDVIVDEEPEELGSTAKPHELYEVIERFCLGRKRIELFGTDRNIRNGWLCIGKSVSFTNFDAYEYNSWFEGDVAWPEVQDYKGGRYTGSTPEIEQLRPKSPPRPS